MPIWAYIELFTIGDISKLYRISLPELKTVIANQFGLHMNFRRFCETDICPFPPLPYFLRNFFRYWAGE